MRTHYVGPEPTTLFHARRKDRSQLQSAPKVTNYEQIYDKGFQPYLKSSAGLKHERRSA